MHVEDIDRRHGQKKWAEDTGRRNGQRAWAEGMDRAGPGHRLVTVFSTLAGIVTGEGPLVACSPRTTAQ